jgi:glycosyltransferase involved in cell wall biosynthesis
MRSASALHRRDDRGGRPDRAASEKPHVCFVAPYLWPVLARDRSIRIVGGAEVQQAVLARLLRRNGYRVSVVTLDYGQPEGAQVDGIAVHKAYRLGEGIPVLRFLHPRLTSLWRAMRAADADIYYQRSADMLTGLVAGFARRHGRRSIYAGASDTDFEPGRQQIRYSRDRWLYERGLARVDRIVVQNEHQRGHCRAHYGRESTVIPSCYELPPASRPEKGESVLWVATVHEYKRPEWVLEIARRLPQRRFVIVGGLSTAGTHYRQGFYEKIQQAAAGLPNVDFRGFLPVEDTEACFDRAQLLLNTSVYEGMPNTFLQAWARGIPTVATVDVGARLREQPVYRTVGSIEQAAEEVERLFTDELHWARSSARCREYFDATHSPEEALARYEAVFRELQAGEAATG